MIYSEYLRFYIQIKATRILPLQQIYISDCRGSFVLVLAVGLLESTTIRSCEWKPASPTETVSVCTFIQLLTPQFMSQEDGSEMVITGQLYVGRERSLNRSTTLGYEQRICKNSFYTKFTSYLRTVPETVRSCGYNLRTGPVTSQYSILHILKEILGLSTDVHLSFQVDILYGFLQPF